jgi:hypothetical protein
MATPEAATTGQSIMAGGEVLGSSGTPQSYQLYE